MFDSDWKARSEILPELGGLREPVELARLPEQQGHVGASEGLHDLCLREALDDSSRSVKSRFLSPLPYDLGSWS